MMDPEMRLSHDIMQVTNASRGLIQKAISVHMADSLATNQYGSLQRYVCQPIPAWHMNDRDSDVNGGVSPTTTLYQGPKVNGSTW
jgi:hypothetical protein